MISIPLMRKALDALEADRRVIVHYTMHNQISKMYMTGMLHLCRIAEDQEMRVTDIKVVKTDEELGKELRSEMYSSCDDIQFFNNLAKRIRAGEFN